MSKKNTDIETIKKTSESLLETISNADVNSRISFEQFTDESTLISSDTFGTKQMKIKILEVSDEEPPFNGNLETVSK